jgi:hypothetical protein
MDVGVPFRSPAEAQFWFEWRKKGWAMPCITVFCLILMLGVWLFFIRKPEDLVEGFVAGGGLLSALALVGGVIFGNTGPNDANFEMGNFLGTRPMRTEDMSRTILKAAALSVLFAWAIWAAAFLSLVAYLFVTNTLPQPLFPGGVQWWYFPATLLGCWTVLALATSGGLMGELKWFGLLYAGLMCFFVAEVVFSKFVLSHAAQAQVFYGTVTTCGVLFVLGTVWAFAAALRRSLIGRPTTCIVLLEWSRHPVEQFPVYLFVIGLMAAAVAPLATAPLALTWNRNR